jgi:hypothetical protein
MESCHIIVNSLWFSGFRSLDHFHIAVNIVRDVILSIDVDMKKFLDGIKNEFYEMFGIRFTKEA